MGLAISKMIAEKLDGSIEVVSDPGWGTAVAFAIRVKVKSRAERLSESMVVPLETARTPLHRRLKTIPDLQMRLMRSMNEKKILLVDDNAYNLFVLKEILLRVRKS